MPTNDNKCELYDKCEFFIYEELSDALINRFRKKYCDALKDACARYMIFSAANQKNSLVPKNLYPNEYGKAMDIIARLDKP
jgi:hypothetical protein